MTKILTMGDLTPQSLEKRIAHLEKEVTNIFITLSMIEQSIKDLKDKDDD